MRTVLLLGTVLCLASCDTSKQELATTQANLTEVTKERDDLKSKVASLQEDLNNTKTQLAQTKNASPSAGAVAARTPDVKTAVDANAKSSKAKHGHKS
ncbi:MAG TPA: hypothetical protein VMT03_19980 [Polyangia bacterium]|nr:hypothetical protein [Polyangia bacterium]